MESRRVALQEFASKHANDVNSVNNVNFENSLWQRNFENCNSKNLVSHLALTQQY